MAKELGEPKVLRSATNFSTFFLYWQGRFREAVRSYEETVPDVEKFPLGGFPLLAALTVGHCYAYVGQITQGLGMLDAIRTHCQQRGNRYIDSEAGITMGGIMLDINRIDDALKYLESSVEEAGLAKNEWMRMRGSLALAYAYYLQGEHERSLAFLQASIGLSSQVRVTVQNRPYLMELCWAMEQGKLPPVPGLSLKKEIGRMIGGENVYMKGVAHRYLSFLQKREGSPPEKILQSRHCSINWLTESGHQVELARSKIELARCYLEEGNEIRAKDLAQAAARILSPLNEALIPDDLKSLIQDSRGNDLLLKEILNLAQDVVAIRDNKDLIQRILSTANRIAGAERGAIFLLDDSTRPIKLHLRASKNLASEQINHTSFLSSMQMISEVAKTGARRILEMDLPENPDSPDHPIIQSRICVPMTLRDKVVGVLYHDNRLLKSAFKESDLDLLAYFSAMAAIALDNAQAYDEIKRLNQKLREEKRYYEEQNLQNLHFEDLIGESAAILRVLAQIEQVAPTEATVLIQGETGVGKELVARAIHRRSPRRDKPFIRVFCNALPDSLIPSELFGHEKGAFTGAIHQRIGRFELADGGTLFLDEIGDLPLEVQVRLLRVLQSKEFERVGGSETLHSDFRLVAATNRDLDREIQVNKFRPDLYYRLNVFPIYVPPLKERREDIPLLTLYFLKRYSTKIGKTFEGIPEAEMERLVQYDWPGNVRELENIIERSTILNSGPIFRIPELGVGNSDSRGPRKDPSLEENERQHILWALQKARWRIKGSGGAAGILKIHPSTLAFRMKKLGIQRPQLVPGRSIGQVSE
jgi:transcriptional regulator with GAF, ATPase, and Fis domain